MALRSPAQRHVVCYRHNFYRNPFCSCHLCRKAEIKPIARVVFYNEQRTIRARCRPDGFQYSVSRWRRKDLTARGGAEHTGSHIPAMCRFMTAATTRDNRDRTLRWLQERLPDQNIFISEYGEMRRLPREPLKHFTNNVGRIVNDFFHGSLPGRLQKLSVLIDENHSCGFDQRSTDLYFGGSKH